MKKGQNRRSCPYTGKCEPEKSRILTYFAQCVTTSHCKKKKKKERKTDCLSIRSTVNFCVGSVFIKITTTKFQRNC